MLLSLSGLDLCVDKFKKDKRRKTRNPVRGLRAGRALQGCAGLGEEVGLQGQRAQGECGWKQHRLGLKPGHGLCFQEEELPCHPSDPLGGGRRLRDRLGALLSPGGLSVHLWMQTPLLAVFAG